MSRFKLIYPKKMPKNIDIFMTTRQGGVSSNLYESFNFGYFTDDYKENVLKNYEILKRSQNIETLTVLNQVHGTEIFHVTDDNKQNIFFNIEADGLFTICKNITLAIVTADCYPVILVGDNAICALHCGWRSANGGIIKKAIKMFKQSNDSPNFAYIGAGISKDDYIVQQDMVDKLSNTYKNNVTKFSEGYKFDLKQSIIDDLIEQGIENIEYCELSTNSELFYSYRRDKGKTGRMLTLVTRYYENM